MPDRVSKTFEQRPDLGYVLQTELFDDGSKVETRIPYRDNGPSTLRKAANFGKAAASHVAAGRPEAHDAQVDERYAICQSCPSSLYEVRKTITPPEGATIEIGRCTDQSCGCVLAPSRYEGLNKLRWADQFCPKSHWGAVDVVH